jgi:hypothetical protein
VAVVARVEGGDRQLKFKAFAACRPMEWLYNTLVKFVRGHPWGDYKEFVEFLLMGVGMSGGGGDHC